MSFEYFVRPFQSTDVYGRAIIPATPEGLAPRATLTWGGKTELEPNKKGAISVTTHWPDSNSACCTEASEQQGLPEYARSVNITNMGPSGGTVEVKVGNVLEMDKRVKNACGGTASTASTSPLISQFNASSASVLANYEREAAQMGVRTPTEERCKVKAAIG